MFTHVLYPPLGWFVLLLLSCKNSFYILEWTLFDIWCRGVRSHLRRTWEAAGQRGTPGPRVGLACWREVLLALRPPTDTENVPESSSHKSHDKKALVDLRPMMYTGWQVWQWESHNASQLMTLPRRVNQWLGISVALLSYQACCGSRYNKTWQKQYKQLLKSMQMFANCF